MPGTGEVWIFAYGSLIWRPDFDFAERPRARLDGYRRGFFMTSIHYRGTPEAPGLVLALDAEPGASCEGVAYRLDPGKASEILEGVRARELVSRAYDERMLPVVLEDGRRVEAITYVVNRVHAQYRGGLDPAAQAEVIARAVGPMGPNIDYLESTVAGLAALGVSDPDLGELLALARAAVR